ncbi:HepT-like ribonuclease domain-containing protein [Brevundimonas nasdae]|uniref:HepT-like ribonuclease domain-containing protein n=1 Tax=Brevundimonas nasdae TaxID=172043 RepID=UPI00068E4494|nr:HepT-like ribonuclease domain-containing protein [Brevundimonas nasdae]
MNPTDRADILRLEQISDLLDSFQRDFGGMTRAAFAASPLHQDAATHRLMHIGEKTNHLSDDLKARHPDIPWREMKGFRHIAAHAYERVSPDLVWTTMTGRLGPVRDMVSAELARDAERAAQDRGGLDPER